MMLTSLSKKRADKYFQCAWNKQKYKQQNWAKIITPTIITIAAIIANTFFKTQSGILPIIRMMSFSLDKSLTLSIIIKVIVIRQTDKFRHKYRSITYPHIANANKEQYA